MLDNSKIKDCLGLIERIWLYYPELRFHQLINHLQHEYIEFTGETGWYVNRTILSTYGNNEYREDDRYIDMFHLLDDKWIDFLKSYVRQRDIF